MFQPMTVLTTGNPSYGLAAAIAASVGGDFASRSNGYDLCSDEGRARFAEASLSYDVVVNCAALWRFNQTLVAEAVWKRWAEAKKRGLIVNVGSTADTGVRGSAWLYPIEKKSLRDFSRNLTYAAIGGSGIRATYVSFGYIATPKVLEKHPDKKMITTEQAAGVIKWLIEQPDCVNINEISLDPIQVQI